MKNKNPSINMIVSTIIAAANKSLKDFGTYTFDDKGVREVMDLNLFIDVLRRMPPVEAAEVILSLSTATEIIDSRGRAVAGALVGELDDWDELFEQPGIEELY